MQGYRNRLRLSTLRGINLLIREPRTLELCFAKMPTDRKIGQLAKPGDGTERIRATRNSFRAPQTLQRGALNNRTRSEGADLAEIEGN
jgi:hypothetical protein